MVTEEGVGMIHLTLVQDAKEKGRISVHLNTQELGTVSVEAKVGSDSAELYGISDTSADKLSEKLEQAAEELKDFMTKRQKAWHPINCTRRQRR